MGANVNQIAPAVTDFWTFFTIKSVQKSLEIYKKCSDSLPFVQKYLFINHGNDLIKI